VLARKTNLDEHMYTGSSSSTCVVSGRKSEQDTDIHCIQLKDCVLQNKSGRQKFIASNKAICFYYLVPPTAQLQEKHTKSTGSMRRMNWKHSVIPDVLVHLALGMDASLVLHSSVGGIRTMVTAGPFDHSFAGAHVRTKCAGDGVEVACRRLGHPTLVSDGQF